MRAANSCCTGRSLFIFYSELTKLLWCWESNVCRWASNPRGTEMLGITILLAVIAVGGIFLLKFLHALLREGKHERAVGYLFAIKSNNSQSLRVVRFKPAQVEKAQIPLSRLRREQNVPIALTSAATVHGDCLTMPPLPRLVESRPDDRAGTEAVVQNELEGQLMKTESGIIKPGSDEMRRKRVRFARRRAAGAMRFIGLILLGIAGVLGLQAHAQAPAVLDTRSSEGEVERLSGLIQQLEARVAQLEAQTKEGSLSAPTNPSSAAAVPQEPTGQGQTLSTDDQNTLNFLRGTTLNASFDGYYGYNFNSPVGRVNLLRAYDVISNNFSLNQAGVILERAPNFEAGRRLGLRLDLMYGQATETLQGGAQNEPRPQAYRPVFQAYGTYVFPVGSGLSVDFGKFASALGYEGNYTKDQINYSRAYWFNFLPFYHFGFRTTYNVNDKLSITNWLVNGANQTEDFNGFKSTAFLVNIKPTSRLSWNINYYAGREQRDLVPLLNPGLPALPTQPGLSTTPVTPKPDGRFHVFDTYAAWNATDRLLLVGELDTVINRISANDAPTRVSGGAAYAKYQFTPRFSLGGRFALMQDSGGLFSGISQTLKDTTLTATYQLANGFQTKFEWRRDFSNRPFFLTEQPGVLKKEQNTASVGLVWWWGGKEGPW
ncbi:MAG: outer membrane beta-barrel protein [Candidatus Korobacteraceae bacterium]